MMQNYFNYLNRPLNTVFDHSTMLKKIRELNIFFLFFFNVVVLKVFLCFKSSFYVQLFDMCQFVFIKVSEKKSKYFQTLLLQNFSFSLWFFSTIFASFRIHLNSSRQTHRQIFSLVRWWWLFTTRCDRFAKGRTNGGANRKKWPANYRRGATRYWQSFGVCKNRPIVSTTVSYTHRNNYIAKDCT